MYCICQINVKTFRFVNPLTLVDRHFATNFLALKLLYPLRPMQWFWFFFLPVSKLAMLSSLCNYGKTRIEMLSLQTANSIDDIWNEK